MLGISRMLRLSILNDDFFFVFRHFGYLFNWEKSVSILSR